MKRTVLTLVVLACSAVTSWPSVAHAAPIRLNVAGTLVDGGTFSGWLLYGENDQDPVADVGRFQGGLWEMTVTGPSSTFISHTLGGRALVESGLVGGLPFVGLFFLSDDPGGNPDELPKIGINFAATAGYDPDIQPTLVDFGPFFLGVYTDLAMNRIAVESAYVSVPEPSTMVLWVLALGAIPWRRRLSRAASTRD